MVGNRNLRRNVEKVIENEGYEIMPSGQWNWGSWGACPTKQRKVAEKLGVKYGIHFDSPLYRLEHVSHHISCITDGFDKECIQYFLDATKNGVDEDEVMGSRCGDLDSHKLVTGRDEIKGISHLIELLENSSDHFGKLPKDFYSRIARFLDINKARLREYLPQEAMDRYEIAA